jgi:hypothetical protein
VLKILLNCVASRQHMAACLAKSTLFVFFLCQLNLNIDINIIKVLNSDITYSVLV